jgi:small-conductance mechanosensitive channel
MIAPQIETRLREIRGNPGLLRFLAILFRRTRWFIFVAILWLFVLVMLEITWPSRSRIVLSAASLATAWLFISVFSRVIRRRTIANIVAVIVWIAAALNIVGLLPNTISLLDSIAFEMQDFRFSLLKLMQIVGILSFLIWLAVLTGQFIEGIIRNTEDLTPSLKVLTSKLTKVVLFLVAVFGGLSIVGVDLTAFAFFSGAVGLGLGFGLQKVISNLVSGVILLADKSIKPGDVISVGETFGKIDQLAARYVSVIARDGREYLVPNEDLITNPVLNWSFSSNLVRLDLKFGASYDADPYEVRALAREAAHSHDRTVDDPKPVCHITEFGDSSVNYILRFWISDPEKGVTNIRGDVFLNLWDKFKEANIKIPYPHREVFLHQADQDNSE